MLHQFFMYLRTLSSVVSDKSCKEQSMYISSRNALILQRYSNPNGLLSKVVPSMEKRKLVIVLNTGLSLLQYNQPR